MKTMRFFTIFLLLLPGVFAVTYQVAVENCGLQAEGNFVCGENIVASCLVNDTLTLQGVNKVEFTIGGQIYTATMPISGSRKYGVWSVTVPVTEVIVGGSLSYVKATAADGTVCGASGNSDVIANCFLNFTVLRGYTVDCDCGWVETTTCNPDNTATVTHSPGIGCSGGTAYVTTGICDYCDSEWVPVYGSCELNRSASYDGSLFTDPFYGLMTKTYRANNEVCYLTSEDPMDRVLPSDNGAQVPCRMDVWSSLGKDAFATGSDVVTQYEDFALSSATLTSQSRYDGRGKLEPLVYDFNQDGQSEIAVMTSSGITFLSQVGAVVGTLVVPGVRWSGEPSLFGYTQAGPMIGGYPVYYGQYVFDNNHYNRTVGVGIAGVRVNSSNGTQFVAYRYESGIWVLKESVNLTVNAANGHSTLCYGGQCFFSTDTADISFFDVFGPNFEASVSYGTFTGPVSNTNPVFVDMSGAGSAVRMGALAIVAARPTDGAYAVLCYLDLSSCLVDYVGSASTISRLISSKRVSSSSKTNLFAVGNEGGIFKLYKIAVGGSWNEFINQSTIDSMDLSGSMAISGTSANDLVSCVSDPVYGFCMGAAPGGVNSVYGVYVASLHGIVNASSGSGSGLSSTFVSLNNRFVQVSGVSPVYAATHVDQYGLSAFIIGSTSGGTTIPRLLVIRDSDGAVVLNETMSIGGLTALFMNIQYFDGYLLIGVSTIVNQYIAMYKVNSGSSVELKDFELSGSEGGKGSVFLGSSGSSVFVMTQTITNKRLHTFSKTSNNFSASVDVLASASADYLYWSDTAKKSYARGANIYYYTDIMSLSSHVSIYSSAYGNLLLWNGNTNDIRIITSGGKKLKGSAYAGLSAAGSTLPSGFVAYGFRDDRMIIGTIPGGVGLSKYWHFVDWSDDALPILVNTTILTVLHSNYSNYGAAPYLSGAAIGTNEIVALQAAIQPILGTYGFSVDRLSYTLGSVPIPSGTINGTFVEYACYVPTDTSFSKVASYSSIDQSICPSSLSVATLGRPVVASGEGLIDIVAGRRIYNLTMEEGVTPAIVDYTSDTFADALFLSDGVVKFLTSSPINKVAQGAFIRMTNVTCSYNEVTRRIDTTGIGVAAKNPTKVTFFADLFNSKGARITYFSNKVNKISSPVVVSDSYTVQYTVLDDLTNEKVTLNCSVDVRVALNVSLNGCSLGNDGEFNFLDSSTRYNWFVSIFNRREVANEPSMVDSAVARFGSGSGIFHPLFCADEGISLDTRLKVGSNAKLEVNVKGQKDGVNYVAAGFILKSDNGVVTVYKMTGSGNVGEIQGDSISSFNVNEYKVISLRVNQLLNEFALSIDGENKGSGVLINDINGEFSEIEIKQYNSGSVDVDYIRTGGLTGSVRTIRNETEERGDVARSYLRLCNSTSERDFDVYPAGTGFYPNVAKYCNVRNGKVEADSEPCSMDQLQDAIAFNSLCYAEAYSYCVFEAFPKKGNSEFATEQSGLDGATACSLSLGLSAGTSKIIAPVMSGVWGLAKGHWLVSTIFLVLVVIAVFFAFWPRR